MPFALTISGLSKTYPNGVRALDGVSLTIPTGMFGLLGPNGAGKSTLMRTLATLQEADAGSVALGDIDVLRDKDAVRRTLGYLPQDFGVYPKVSAEELLDHLALLKGLTTAATSGSETVAALLQQTNLYDVRKQGARRILGRHAPALRHRAGAARQPAADHRRRADGRPRSRGARPLPQPAGGDRRERHRHPLDAHRVGRVATSARRMAIINKGRVMLAGESGGR